jgi:hypothetical protein
MSRGKAWQSSWLLKETTKMHEFTQNERKKGGRVRNKLYPGMSRRLLANVKTSQTQSELGKRAREYEKIKTMELRKKFDKVYFPTSVCDRIAVMGTKVYLIEIKKPGSKLSRDQARIKNLLDGNYLVVS